MKDIIKVVLFVLLALLVICLCISDPLLFVVGILLYIFRPFVSLVIMSFTDFFSDYTSF